MYEAPYWRTRPVFISSTFRDMEIERIYLRDKVFPVIEDRLRQRFHHLEAIDLRWGVETKSVADEQGKELLVLKVCLAEIERSRPFLVVLMGDRYGWVPPAERMRTAIDEAGFVTDVAGKSVTALEIEYGVLASREQVVRSRFYLRQPLPYDQMAPETAALYSDRHNPAPGSAESADRLDLLKAGVRGMMEPLGRCQEYAVSWDAARQQVSGLEALGQMVLEGLWQDLEEETRRHEQEAPPTWQQRQRADLDQFVEHRQRGFVGREALSQELLHFALAPEAPGQPWGMCLGGEPGSGKSALFAHMYRQLLERQAGGEIILLAHAAGINPDASRVELILRRWVGELAGFLQTSDPLHDASTPEEIEQAFSMLMHQASQRRRLVVLIDALNQLENLPRARSLTWLPQAWPANARLMATAIPGPECAALTQRQGAKGRELPSLDQVEAGAIFRSVCDRYHRTLHPEVLAALLAKRRADGQPAASNPLWLTMAVEELNLLDADDLARAEREFSGSPEDRLHQLLLDIAQRLPAEIEDLYAWLLERSEELWGTAWSRAFANLIAVSRGGWRESDFEVLLPRLTNEAWDPLRFVGLRRSFRAHLMQTGAQGQWDFFHLQARAAVLRRNLADPAKARSLHIALADHLLVLPADDQLHISETMHHLYEADDKQRAAEYYGSELSDTEALGASKALAGRILEGERQERNQALEWVVALLGLEQAPGQQAALCNRCNFDLNNLLESTSRLGTRRDLLQAALNGLQGLSQSDPSNAGWLRDLSVSHNKVGDVLKAQGDLAGALKAYRDSLAIAERLSQSDPSNAGWLRDLSVSHNKVGDVLKAQGDLAGALKAYRDSLAIAERLSQSDPSNAGWLRDLSVSHDRIGDVLLAQGDLAGALKAYRDSLAIRERLSQSDPSNAGWLRDLSVSHDKVGDVLKAQGDLAGALKAYRDSLAIAERLSQSDPSNAGWLRDLSVSHDRIGDVLLAQGDLAGALKAYRDSLAIRERLSQSDPSNAGWLRDLSVSHDKVGDVLKAQGDLAGALKAYRDSLAIRERLSQSDPSNAGWLRDLSVSHERIGDVLLAQGDLAGALKAYRDSLAIRERLSQSDPSNAGWLRDLSISHDRIGDVLLAQGDLAGALKAYRDSLAIRERLSQSDPSNAGWQMDLSISHERIGDVLLAQGDLAGALKAYRDSLAIRERLSQSDPSNAGWQMDLSVSHDRIGDVLLAQGDLAGALKAYRDSLAIRERLSQSDPSNAGWLRDLWVSYWKIAYTLEKAGDQEGKRFWRQAYDVLAGMKQKGLFVSPQDEQFLARLAQKVKE